MDEIDAIRKQYAIKELLLHIWKNYFHRLRHGGRKFCMIDARVIFLSMKLTLPN